MQIRDFNELSSVSNGKVLLGVNGQICKTDNDLSEIIGDLVDAATSGKVDTTAYDAKMSGIDESIIGIGAELDDLDGKIEAVSAGVDESIAAFGAELDEKIDIVSAGIDSTYDYAMNVSATVSDALELKEDKVFVAEYGVTTYQEIETAYNAGKQIVCKYRNSMEDKYTYFNYYFKMSGYEVFSFYIVSCSVAAGFGTTYSCSKSEGWTKRETNLQGELTANNGLNLTNNIIGLDTANAASGNVLSYNGTGVEWNNSYLTKTSADVDYQPKGDYVPLATYNTLTAKVQELETLLESYSGRWVLTIDPYNPLGLPPFTIRCKFENGYTPAMGDSQVLVDSTENIWDITKNDTNWSNLFGTTMIEVLGANTTGVTNMSGLFHYCQFLTTVPLFDTSTCTDMSYMFNACYGLTEVPLFDTSSCTNMSSMFEQCWNLTTVPLLNTSNCTNMYGMFYGCTSLTAVPLFDTSSCTSMQSMFYGCTKLTTIPLFDTSVCTNMSTMFNNCTNVQSGALAIYQQASTQTTPPRNHSNTFKNCGSNTQSGVAELENIPPEWGGNGLSDYTIQIVWADNSEIELYHDGMVKTRVTTSSPYIWNVTYPNADWMGIFAGQNKLVEVKKANIPNVTALNETFHLCNGLTAVSNMVTNKVTNTDDMFMTCNNLSEVEAFNTSNVTSMSAMFFRCPKLKYVPLLDTTNTTNMQYTFYDCAKIESGALALYNQASTQAIPPSNHYETFYNCGSNTTQGAAELAQISSDWK